MIERPRALFSGVVLLVISACGGSGEDADTSTTSTISPATTTPATTAAPVSTTASSTSSPDNDGGDEGGDDTNVMCVVTVAAGDSLNGIVADLADDGVTVAAIQDENLMSESTVIHPGDQLDICIGNDLDDVTGESRLAPSADAVLAQQERVNELFAGFSIGQLALDGDSGPYTRRQLCAARMGLGLPASTAHMAAGGRDETALMAADSISVPDGAATWRERWILIDKTCQVMFIGEGETVVDVFQTSTGEAGFETHDVLANPAFRFDPALDNGGWHDSRTFPTEVDNPLNGNMYKPIYFNRGQAIHGANNVPPSPQSKGCARLSPWHQDLLIEWLGIGDITEATWNESDINVTVTVQGTYRPD